MYMKNLTQIIKDFIYELFGKEGEIVAVVPDENGWKVTTEVLMDEEYTISRGRNDLLYVFEVIIDNNQNIVSYQRSRIRERGKLDE